MSITSRVTLRLALSSVALLALGALALARHAAAGPDGGTPAQGADAAAAPPAATAVALQFRPLLAVLSEALDDPLLSGALVAARVESLSRGDTLFAHNPDLLVNPASVTKVFTTAAALALLHPDYRFKTEVYAHHEPDGGEIKGPLYLKGYGDPFLVNERLTYLAAELHALDIRKIDGPIVLDDSYFDSISEGPGWSQDDSSRPYQALMGALSLNFNTVALLIFPGEKPGAEARVEIVPDSDHFKLDNRIQTGNRTRRIRLETRELGLRTRIRARGQIGKNHPGFRYHLRVLHPTWYMGHSFRMALRRAGIKVRRSLRRGTVPRWAELLYTLRSPELGELVRKVNKRSQNFMAEQLLKTLGAELLSEPASWPKGQRVLRAFLDEEVGIEPGTYVLHNGSGLNDVNRVTVSQTCALLRYMWGRFDIRADFAASLAVAGADGTVGNRFTQPALTRTMRLKTGSLERTRALAGYVHTQGGEDLAFAIFIARYDCRGYEAVRVIDRFASALARADADRQVIEQTEVTPAPETIEGPVRAEVPLVGPVGPDEGSEAADVPVGEPVLAP
ncbi:MAG: D-alanyl-D-alanine carboxypeptidase/D-alanyl-D-alanine-endopeptidase [Deltaproteobacteria bacterium]|nr:D-alanyl-D-alanine carboxypeptidase/D-alanyl-D-alanine-endopeptidase [Deltaproteobacteria bacterium]